VLREARARSASLIENRPTVEGAADVLGTAFDGPSALSAAVDDLFEVAKRNTNPGSLDDETSWHLILFAVVSEQHGHDWAITADRFRRALCTSNTGAWASVWHSCEPESGTYANKAPTE
jgi:hypothetical protein